ncbi:TonB-dependent receptor [plant metagenome]|uniref:TonB-dependent receptor n=1 Tax=plant metagenome TaxID=1297885 RepID=A0A484SFD3_9ZZZZ
MIVTANRREQAASRVPMSMEVFSEERLERQNIRNFSDIASATPGLRFAQSNLGQSWISIRGVVSAVGASTTGLYIDDTPIQVRSLGNSSSTFTPSIFDLERVEVLRGPQGTLFGDSSMGGAIRFITPEPDLHDYTGYARAETSTTTGGSNSYEGGFAIGGPIVEGSLGFRASGYFQHAGGWIDRMAGRVTARSLNGSAGPMESLDFTETGLYASNTNNVDTSALRFALQWAPTDNLTIKPSVHYEKRESDDIPLYFWPILSDPGSSRYVRPIWRPTVDATHTPLPAGAPDLEPGTDEFFLPSLNIEWNAGAVDVVSTTSYLDRDQESFSDYTTTYVRLFSTSPVPRPGDYTYVIFGNRQKVFTQELRLQNANPDSAARWVGGVFYSRNEQISNQVARPNFVMGTVFPPAVDGGAPFGPGYSAYMNRYGVEPEDSVTYRHNLTTNTDQLAVFGQVDWEFAERWTLTAGLRWTRADIGFDAVYGGPNNNLRQPRGLACVPGTGTAAVPCDPVEIGQYAPGEGPFAPEYATTSNSGSESPVTPKLGLSYQYDSNNMFYATAARGYRIGGAQARVPGTCRDELITLGFLDGNSPEIYESDTVTSYELGAKNRLFGGRVSLDTAIYQIDWEDIQTSTNLSTCGVGFIRNGNSATVKGIDFSMAARATDNLRVELALGYQRGERNEAEIINGRLLSSAGAPIANVPRFQGTLSAHYDFTLPNQLNGFARADWQHIGQGPRPDTGPASYDPFLPRTPKINTVNAQAGVYLGDMTLYVFASNLLNDDTVRYDRALGSPLWGAFAPRPRTVGVGLSYRF